MKILVLASWYPRNASDPTGSFIKKQVESLKGKADVRVVDCTQRTGLLPRSFLTFARTAQIYLKCLQEGWRPDIIHAHAAYPAGWIGARLKRKWNVPLIITEHTGPISLLEPYFRSRDELVSLYKNSDALVSVSQFQKKQIQLYSTSLSPNFHVIGNIVARSFFDADLNVWPKKPAVCFIGGLTPAKGAIALIDTFRHYAGPKVTLNILGEGPLQKQIQETLDANPNVDVNFFNSRSKNVIDVLTNSCALILTSQHETFSLVAAESLAMGRPVLGFDCGGPSDFVGAPYKLLKERRPQLLSELIATYVTGWNEGAAQEAALGYREGIQNQFTSEAVSEKLMQLYRKIGKSESLS